MTPEMEALVEKVGRAIYVRNMGYHPRASRDFATMKAARKQSYLLDARAAITATLEGLMEPTEGMVEAGTRRLLEPGALSYETAPGCFRAMLSAALQEMKGEKA